jgi:hypothetical protein
MLGPAADELAEMWREGRLYRYERQLKCVEKAERMAHEAGYPITAVITPLCSTAAKFRFTESTHPRWRFDPALAVHGDDGFLS